MLAALRLKPLDLKLLRDLWRLRGHVVAVALVAACGTASLVTMFGAYRALVVAQARYYDAYRFADVFASAKRAPQPVLERVRAVPGVAVAYDRVVHQVTLDVPGLGEPATGRLISIPETPQDVLNGVHLRSGRYIEPGARDEVLVSESFAKANGLQPGDAIAAVINGRWQQLVVVGIAISPEFVAEMFGGAFPDYRHFGILWMGREALEASLDMQGAFNDLAIRLAPGASIDQVVDAVDVLLAPYGGLGAYSREHQLSHQFVRDELNQDRVTGTVVPVIFLAVAAFLIHNVLLRLIALQRAQIGVLRAFGYGRFAIAAHFAKLAIATVLAGCAAGIALGVWLGRGLAALYREFFHFPELVFSLTGDLLAGVVFAGLATALGGALFAVRRALALAPAEAMRPEAPPTFRPLLIERLGLQRLVPPALRMVLRDLERRPLRAALSALAIALATALLVVGQYSIDALDEIVRVFFRGAMREDLVVEFNEPRSMRVKRDLAALPGVLRVEPGRRIAARLRFEHRTRRVAIETLEAGSELRRIVDLDLRPIELPPDGLVLSAKLAEVLGARPGDTITVELLEGERYVRQVAVAGVVDELIGLGAYLDARAGARLLGEAQTADHARLAIDPLFRQELYARLKAMPAVASVSAREATLASFLDTIARNITISTTVLIAFACVIAAGIVYNGARIALSEHAIELASLRILGFTQGEVGAMLLAEQAILTAIAIPLGCALGYAIAGWLVAAVSGEVYRLPLIVSARTYLVSAGVVVGSALASGGLVLYRLRRFDLVAVLKARE